MTIEQVWLSKDIRQILLKNILVNILNLSENTLRCYNMCIFNETLSSPVHQTTHKTFQAWSSSTVDSRPTLIRLSPATLSLSLRFFLQCLRVHSDRAEMLTIMLNISWHFIAFVRVCRCSSWRTVSNDRRPFGMRTNDPLVARDRRPTTDRFLCYTISANISFKL